MSPDFSIITDRVDWCQDWYWTYPECTQEIPVKVAGVKLEEESASEERLVTEQPSVEESAEEQQGMGKSFMAPSTCIDGSSRISELARLADFD